MKTKTKTKGNQEGKQKENKTKIPEKKKIKNIFIFKFLEGKNIKKNLCVCRPFRRTSRAFPDRLGFPDRLVCRRVAVDLRLLRLALMRGRGER